MTILWFFIASWAFLGGGENDGSGKLERERGEPFDAGMLLLFAWKAWLR